MELSLQVDLTFLVDGRFNKSEPQTNFGTKLFQLLLKADQSNIEKLRKGFPNAVRTMEEWRKTGIIPDYPYD